MKAYPLSRVVLFFAIVAGGIGLDLATKSWAFARLGMPGAQGKPEWVLGKTVGLETSLNEGALFGLGQGMVPVFACLSLAAAAAVLVWLFWGKAICDRLLAFSLAAVLAGILGNLYDRMGMAGLTWNYANDLHDFGDPVYAVRDWVLVMIGPWHWPNFNIADSMLVGGAILLMLHAFFVSPKQPEQIQKPDAEPSP